ncbi:traB domain-containing protein isoform X2 [Impatiens glandulifera]|uniref:traB domain-containing protein isoform X2 n=1 Tax=Impatiens glandulifera TaxID=253017 RepID=UPI001FB05C22|nr:traB domain-containing protein isoform X2 [Impatiens glandulifera]
MMDFSMKKTLLLASSFSLLGGTKCMNTYSYPFKSHSRSLKPIRVSIAPPPPDFDYKSSLLTQSRQAIARAHPELLDLADNGSLVLISKTQFGPVPPWRTEFVEPEAIWLIGTSHISPQSASDVERVLRTVNPDNVVVELCRSRAGIMYTGDEPGQQLRSNMFSLSGAGFFGAVGRSLDLGGQTALALRLLLATFSSKISSDVNRPFGDEFRAARRVSENIGAQIVLGDRPIEITLERAWNSLDWNEKLNLLLSVFRGITSSSIDTTKFKDDDSSYQLYEQLSFSYPSLLQSLIHERDVYMSWSLKRSKAVNNSKRVVGVIGKGHLNGVIYSLISDTGNLRFRDLAGKKSSGDASGSWVVTLLKNLARDTLIGILLWALFEQIKKLS